MANFEQFAGKFPVSSHYLTDLFKMSFLTECCSMTAGNIQFYTFCYIKYGRRLKIITLLSILFFRYQSGFWNLQIKKFED
jgi:hypothetical protein